MSSGENSGSRPRQRSARQRTRRWVRRWTPSFSGRAAAASQLDAGRAAIAAGAVQAGVDCLRRARADAASCGDPALQARALVALGGALVHAVRGRDEEGAAVLHEAIRLATEAGDRETAVTRPPGTRLRR